MIQLTSLPIVYPEIFLLLMTSVVALVGVNASESRLNAHVLDRAGLAGRPRAACT